MAHHTCKFSEFNFEHKSSISIHCDNQSTRYIAKDYVFPNCTKHIVIDYYLVRDYLVKKVIYTSFTSSSKQLADI